MTQPDRHIAFALPSRFECVTFLARGGHGCVFRAVDTTADAEDSVVAVKRMNMTNMPRYSRLLCLREVEMIRKFSPVSHQVVEVFETMQWDGPEGQRYLLIVMRYVPCTLDILRQTNKLTSMLTVRYVAAQILLPIALMHQLQCVHRDVTPRNLLVDASTYDLWLADFGLSRSLDHAAGVSYGVGTIWYRAPEVSLGVAQYGTPIDAWSAGAIIAELLVGHPLFNTSKAADDSVHFHKIATVCGAPLKQWFEPNTTLSTTCDQALQFIKNSYWEDECTLPFDDDRRTVLRQTINADEIRKAIPDATSDFIEEFIEVVLGLLVVPPEDRLTALGALNCKAFDPIRSFVKEHLAPAQDFDEITLSNQDASSEIIDSRLNSYAPLIDEAVR